MYYRATTEPHGQTAELSEGSTHEHVDESGPLVQTFEPEPMMRPAPYESLCFSTSVTGALIGCISANNISDTYYIYETTAEPDIRLENLQGVWDDLFAVDTTRSDSFVTDFDILEEVRYKNPNENPIAVQKTHVLKPPTTLVERVDACYDGKLHREKLLTVKQEVAEWVEQNT